MSCNYGCVTLPAHQTVICGDYPLGGISAYAVLECDHTIEDFTSAIDWAANIASGKAKVVMNIKAEVAAAAANMQDNPIGCGPEQIVQGYDNTINITDKNVLANNDDFYAKLNGRRLYLVLFMCEMDEIVVSNTLVDFAASPRAIPMSNRENQQYSIVASFYSRVKEIPLQVYDAPAGIFTE